MIQNSATLKQIRELITNSKPGDEPLPIQTRDLLLFGAIIDIYDQLETFEPLLPFYRASMWVGAILGTAIVGIIVGVITHQIEIVFK